MCKTISIITVNKNNLNGLIKTFESVTSQDIDIYEYIIVDGFSNDGSIEYLNNISSSSHLKIIIEKDLGIYDAMNKAINIAKGDFIIFMNSGDCFADNSTLKAITNVIDSKSEILYGNYFHGNQLVQLPKKLNLLFFKGVGGSICHQASVIKRTLFNDLGIYDINYKYVADTHFFIKAYLKNVKFSHIPLPLVLFDTSGIGGSLASFNEKMKCYNTTAPFFLKLLYHPLYIYYIIKWEYKRNNLTFFLSKFKKY
jgi:glycosyltransferase involved in cell wall biosynthesis